MKVTSEVKLKPLIWIGGTRRDLVAFPEEIVGAIGYALYHVFQKKSKTGIKTPKAEIDLVKARLRKAEELHAGWLQAMKGAGGHG